MKKIIALALAAVMSISMVACGNNTDEPKEPEAPAMTVVEVLDKVLEEAPMPTEMVKTELDLADADSVMYFTGVADPAKFEKVAVAEPMIGAIPVSFVVAKVAEGVDAEAVRAEMVAGIDMAKWVCVNAEIALSMVWEDGVVVFAMMTENEELSIDAYKDAFVKVKGDAKFAEIIDNAPEAVEGEVVEGEVLEGEATVPGIEVEDEGAEDLVEEKPEDAAVVENVEDVEDAE